MSVVPTHPTSAPVKSLQSLLLPTNTASYAKGKTIANKMRAVLSRVNGTDPNAISDKLILTDTILGRILFVVLNPSKMVSVEPYRSKNVLSLLKAETRYRVFFRHGTDGFRYVVHLEDLRSIKLPLTINYPGWQRGRVLVGQTPTGPAMAMSWAEFGHCAIAGITQYGKSNGLRVLCDQALQEGHEIYLGNFASNTWNPLLNVSHPQIKALVNTPGQYLSIIDELITERDRRQKMFADLPGAPDNLDEYNHLSSKPLPRIIAFFDEFSAAIEKSGGAKSELAVKAVELLKTALKYGIQLILAGQDFYVSDIGHLVNHCSTRICLRVNNPHLSHSLVGTVGADKLKFQGRALTNKWKRIQIYLITKDQLLGSLSSPSTGLTPPEEALVKALWAYADQPGWMDITRIRDAAGLSQDKARSLRGDFVSRGFAKHFPDKNNGIYLTVKV